ncbi:CoB--CoM heterodisulfide reductase subunit C [Methanobacterium alkalithermotolerans]|nr:CoB--CoM heterodisulfide reductase subunit C [Methanobacterium alkalithermotolerans]
MSVLKRLKNFLSGEKEESTEEKKTESPESKVSNTSQVAKDKTPEAAEVSTKKDEVPDKVEEVKVAEVSTKKDEVPDKVEEVKAETTETETAEDSSSLKEEPTEKPADEVESVEETEETSEDELEPQNVTDEKPKLERSEKMTLLDRDENLLKREDIDKEFSQEIKEAGGDSLEYCFQCGTCTGSCPSGRRTPYRVRQIIRKTNMGLKDEVMADPNLWMCTTCYACQERCPRKIKIVDVVKLARNHAAQAGFMAPAHKMTGSFVIKTGHGVPINDATMELRKRVGLGELPPTTHQFPGALEEVQTILKATGFDSLIGYNWETGELE